MTPDAPPLDEPLDEDAARIASALHDQTGPCLFALNAALHRLRMALDGLPETERAPLEVALAEAERQAGALKRAIRNALEELDPAEGGDLRQMLAELAEGFSGQGATVRLTAGPAPRLPPRVTVVFYRFVRESVLNALRHGKASRVDIRLFYEGTDLVAHVIDTGQGPPADTLRPGRGFRGIASRAASVHASWQPPHHRDGRTITELRMTTQ